MINPNQATATIAEIADEIAKPSASSNLRESVLLDLCYCALVGLLPPRDLSWNVEASLQLLSDDWHPKPRIARLPAATVVQPALGPSIPDGTLFLDERQSPVLEITPAIIVENLANAMGPVGETVRDLLEEHAADTPLKLADHFKLHGLPPRADYARPLIEGLALSKAGVRQFCEHTGWSVPKWAAEASSIQPDGAATPDCRAAPEADPARPALALPLKPGSTVHTAVTQALKALAAEVRNRGGGSKEGERVAAANQAAGRTVRRDDVRTIWGEVAPDLKVAVGRPVKRKPQFAQETR